MITNFSASAEAFAAARKKVLADNDEQLRPHVAEALSRMGLPSWEMQIVDAALDVFDTTARAEVDQWSQVLDDMRDAFAHELSKALQNTKPAANRQAQIDAITSWASAMAHNAAMEAATTSDPDPAVGLEWVTMNDGKVREAHQQANGQRVPTGHEFEVGGEKLMYPGQPVGDPANWMNCRCVARPTMLDGFTGRTITASAEAPITSCVIVALPAASDSVSAASSEADGAHETLLYLGESSAIDSVALNNAVQEFVERGQVGIITDKTSGRGTLGADSADVVLMDAANMVNIRAGLLEQDYIAQAYQAVEQFPVWIPHVTLGYPETPALAEYAGDAITFDRLAVWNGEDRTEHPLGGTMPESDKVIHPEDPECTQEIADAFVATVAEAEPTAPAPAAEAAPAAGADEGLRPWHGVLAPEGAPSGDRRALAARSLTTRDLPLPLKAMFVDDEGHKGSVVVGRIDKVFRDGGLIKAEGVFDISEEADRAVGMVERKMWRGVSVDLDAMEASIGESEDGQEQIDVAAGRISSATMCAIPAFAEAFVRMGSWADAADEPLPTGNKVEIPDAPAFSLVAAAPKKISADFFRNPMLEEPTPMTLGEDGHIYGHLGEWSTCHIGYDGVCTTVPPSVTDYAFFLTGQVFTDAGPVAVGQITVGTGHAKDGLSIRATMAHYDNTGSAVADITVGEDAHGVWFSGRIRPWATEKQVHEMFAAALSGDWREVYSRGRHSMELVAALAVNVQGFPVPRTSFAVENGRQLSLVAAGIVRRPEGADFSGGVSEEFRSQFRAMQQEQERKIKADALSADIRALRFSELDTVITALKGI